MKQQQKAAECVSFKLNATVNGDDNQQIRRRLCLHWQRRTWVKVMKPLIRCRLQHLLRHRRRKRTVKNRKWNEYKVVYSNWNGVNTDECGGSANRVLTLGNVVDSRTRTRPKISSAENCCASLAAGNNPHSCNTAMNSNVSDERLSAKRDGVIL